MKKIILTIILSSLLPALAVAEDKRMRNTNGSTPNVEMKGKHMMNTHTSASDVDMKGRHMSMGDNPFSSHQVTQGNKKAAKETTQGYSVIKYKK